LLGTQPPDASFRRAEACVGFDLVGDEPIPERWVVEVEINGGVREVSVVPASFCETGLLRHLK
jgi:hypothetical protein